MSVAGGLPLAVDRAVLHGCQAVQIFTKNANQWRARPLLPEEVTAFRARLDASGITPAISHASYLINLASPGAALRAQSIAAMGEEIDRAESLGLFGVVLHPGTSADAAAGLALIGDALVSLFDARPAGRAMVLLEHTAGQGRSLGSTFEEIASIIARANGHARLGVCLDTCHLLASGHDIASASGYAATFDAFGRTIGFDRLKVFHMNDSKKPLGSRVDRHTHIGEGHVGLQAFKRLVSDPRFADLPMLLETPKEDRHGPRVVGLDRHDEKNLAILRSLVAS
jgi:deoxyribonuclease-4